MQTVLYFVLPGGETTVFDRADERMLDGFMWRVAGAGYVQAQRGKLYLYMHRLIAGAGSDEKVDHVNGNKLDNRSCNIRIATSSQNGANRGPDRRKLGTTSRHKGVSWSKSKQRWVAYVHFEGRTRWVGRFTDEDDAARAYNAAALECWGEFARLNDV